MQVSCIIGSSVQISGVRGSPLLRFFLMTLGLLATAAGLARVTSAKAKEVAISAPTPQSAESPTSSISVPYRLVLSSLPSEVILEGLTSSSLTADSTTLSGTVQLDPENPHIGLIVKWPESSTSAVHRFAKLTLEIPNTPTFTHVFDSPEDIDDFLELPVSSSK